MIRKRTAIVNRPRLTPSKVHWYGREVTFPDMAAKNSTEANATVSSV